jgi:DNA-binding Lrp family transcriptional regulator
MNIKQAGALDRLVKLLKVKPMTARQIAKATDCATPTVYQRIKALEDRGVKIWKLAVPDLKRSGPPATTFSVTS